MARTLTAAVKTESKKTVINPFVLVELVLDSGTVFVNSTDRDLVWSGNTYTGIGDLGKISEIQESAEIKPSGLTLELSGIPQSHLDIVLTEDYQGRTIKVHQGYLDSNHAIIIDPVLMFEGLIDQMSLVAGEIGRIELTAENKLIRWEKPNIRRYTNEDQQQAFPGDLGLEFVSQVTEKEILWGGTGLR